jgi:hypothetical protein
MDKEHLISKIDDWEQRLRDLYSQIEEWYRQLPPNNVQDIFRGSMLQVDEPLMRQFEVPPRMLPTCALIYGRNRVSFVPSALWIVKGNGMVIVTTSTHRFFLIDMGKAGQSVDWQIETSQLRKAFRSFDRQTFNNLVFHQAIEAA